MTNHIASGSDAPTGAMQAVLIVDDEEAIRRMLKRLFHQALGADVDTASSAEEALGLLERKGYRVILTDFRMQGADGVALLAAARQRWPEVQRVLMTGYTDDDVLRLARERGGIAAFVRKPWDTGELLSLVRGLLASPGGPDPPPGGGGPAPAPGPSPASFPAAPDPDPPAGHRLSWGGGARPWGCPG